MTQILNTSCTLDCPDSCALQVTVDDGKITKVKGSEDHPDTAGYICGKVGRFARRVYHEDRLLYPMRRTGSKGEGRFERISWDQAIETITEKLTGIRDTFGGEAILPYHYGGSNGLLSEEYLDSLFFCRLGASRLDKTICATPSTAARTALYGNMRGMAFSDFEHARFIIIWGANTRGSNIHLLPYIKKAKENGAFVVTINPMHHFSDRDVDMHLGVHPGTDLPLALSMINWWRENGHLDQAFLDKHTTGAQTLLDAAAEWSLERAAEVCRIPAEDIRKVAELYAQAETAGLRCGWGLERNINGARAVGAVLAMPALLGKFGKRGSGFMLSNSSATSFDASTVLGSLDWNTRRLNMTSIASLLTEEQTPPIKALFVYNNNLAATSPDQNRLLKGMAREDLFTVVFEQVHTDSAAMADILLPATTMMEHWDIRKGYGSLVVTGTRPVIQPLGEARSNGEVFSMLGRAMGFSDEAFTWDMETHFEKTAETLRMNGAPADVTRLKQGGNDSPKYEQGIQFQDMFPPDQTVRLAPEAFGDNPYHWVSVDSEDHPLALISPASPKLVTSTFGEFNLPELTVTLNPADARQRDLEHGAGVRVFNELGEVHCKLVVSKDMAAGSALMPKGAWRKASLNGKTSTALCPEHLEPVSGGACFGDARVEVAAL